MRDDRDMRYGMTSLLGHSMKMFPFVILLGLSVPLLMAHTIPAEMASLAAGLAVLVAIAFPWKEHHNNLPVVYGLFYLCAFAILYAWNISSYEVFRLDIYAILLIAVLCLWVALKIIFKRNNEIFLNSNFEFLLIFISWFIPYVVLPAAGVSEHILNAAKFTCFEAIPFFLAMKLIIKRQPDRNTFMVAGLVSMLCIIAIRAV
jgi:UDP-GlcNAc:undecaprenyl-phosphate GlcNAc-1-phosphate transferase